MSHRTATEATRAVRAARLLPGLLGCIAIGALALGLELGLGELGLASVSAIALALVLGMVVTAVGHAGATLERGAGLAVRYGLKSAIVLLGFRFSLGAISALGGPALAVIGVVIGTAFLVALVASRVAGVDRQLGLLIGAGTAICGNSAIAAVAPSLRASDRQIAFASATITLFGTVTMLTLPVLGSAMGLSAEQFGVLAGAGVHDSAQAIASGFLFGEEAGNVATVVKLARTAFLVPVVWALSWIARRDPHLGEDTADGGRRGALVPLFVVGFALAAAVRTVGDELFAGGGWEATITVLQWAADLLLVVAMAGVGLRTRLGELRQLGPRPLVVGLASTVGATLGALLTLRGLDALIG